MRPGVKGRPKPSSEAEQQYKADVALAARRAELLDAAREAERGLRQAQARHAPVKEIHRLAEDLDIALTEAMRAAYAARHAEIAALLTRPEFAHIQRFRFTSPRQAATWLTSLHR